MKIPRNIIKAIDELSGVILTLEDISSARHNIITVLLLQAHFKKGDLDSVQVARLSSLFSTLVEIQLEVENGDASALTRYRAIEKLAVPPKKIQSRNRKRPLVRIAKDVINNYNSSPDLLRGYEFRKLMSELSFVVEPICNCQKPKSLSELLERVKKWETEDTPVPNQARLNVIEDVSENICSCHRLVPKSRIRLREKPAFNREGLFEEVREVLGECSQLAIARLTWEGLAKKIFLEREGQKDAGGKFTERELRRSLKSLEEYEFRHPSELKKSQKLPVFGGRDLLYNFPS